MIPASSLHTELKDVYPTDTGKTEAAPRLLIDIPFIGFVLSVRGSIYGPIGFVSHQNVSWQEKIGDWKPDK